MVLHIDTDRMEALGLTDREMWLYLTLSILSARRPWKGTDEELAAKCKNNLSRATINRLKTNLIQKGLLTEGEDGISPAQNEHASAQNEHDPAQNEQNSKEKEKNQKKIEKKEIKESTNVCVNAHEETHTAASPDFDLINRLFFMDTTNSPVNRLNNSPNQIPANTGYYKIIVLEYGYLNPKTFVDQFYNHWEGKGWPERGNKLFLMRSWMDIYMTKHPKQKPNLSETERLVMRTFLDNIEQRLIVRLFDVVTGFEVYEKKIVFVVKNENIQDFAKWLDSLPLKKIFAAYNRIVTVQPAG